MRKTFLVFGLLFSILALNAQDVTISVDAPSSAVTGQNFRIIYTVNSTDGRFVPPEFDATFTVSGPQSSTSHNVQWINGDVTKVSSTTLVYYIVASQAGTFTIPSARYTIKESTYISDPVRIEVTAEPAQAVQGNSGSQKQSGGSDLSLKLLLNEDEVYVGQPVSATLKLYTRINLAGLNDLRYPELKSFLREDIETPLLKNLQREVIGGVEYGTGVIQRFMLYPQVAGEIRIDPVTITALVQQRTAVNDPFGDPFFSDFFSNVTTVPRELSTGTKIIKVKPLPTPQPSDFQGAVGSFEINATLDKTEVEVNDALTYKVTLKGSGNLTLAGTPVISFPQGIEKYDPKINVKASGPGSGTKVFEYLLIPRNTGTFELPQLSYTVFDANLQKYVTLRTSGFTINVSNTAGGSEVLPPSVITPGEDVKYLGQDIRYIRNDDTSLGIKSSTLVKSVTYWLWFILAFIIALTGMLLRREYIKRNSDITGVRNRKAARVARKRLSKAQVDLKSNKPDLVHEELARALWGYLGDKLSIPLAELTRENCFEALRNRSVDEEIITELDRILAACEYSRFSRTSENESPEGLYKRTVNLIGRMENVL